MRILLVFLFFLPLFATGQNTTVSWQDYSIGTPALHMSLPGKPEPQSTTLPPSVMFYIKKYEAAYLKEDAKGIVVTIMHLTYTDDVAADGHGAIEGTNGQWESTGTKVAILSTTDTKISGKKAIQQRGKLIQGGQENEYMDVVIFEGSKLWQVVVMVKANDASLKSIMQKITDSLAF